VYGSWKNSRERCENFDSKKMGSSACTMCAQRLRHVFDPWDTYKPTVRTRAIALYYSIPIGGNDVGLRRWTYEKPYEAVAGIRKYLAFYPSRSMQ